MPGSFSEKPISCFLASRRARRRKRGRREQRIVRRRGTRSRRYYRHLNLEPDVGKSPRSSASLAWPRRPVSGGPTGAAAGALTMMIGSADSDLALARPVIEAGEQDFARDAVERAMSPSSPIIFSPRRTVRRAKP